MKRTLLSVSVLALGCFAASAQTRVTTQHNDIARTGANSNETVLTPANVNASSFGKLFSDPVDGYVYAQPLYMPSVTMGAGTVQANTTHNVVFVATENDSLYAFDADSNTGANANPLWKVSLIDAAHGAGSGETVITSSQINTTDIVPVVGITGTPVIDPTTGTLYAVAKSTIGGTTFIQRLHAIDITTGKEKFGGPVQLSGSVPGNGNGSSGGTLNWDPLWENNRASLLLVNGIIYIGFGAHNDQGPWHGWILAYNASTLQPTGAWCSTPDSLGGGIWLGGTGLAADVPSGKPYGRIFTVTGNGTFDATAPNYSNAMDYGDSIVKLDLANGVPTMISGSTTVGDDYTPSGQERLNNNDSDQGSGGAILLPDSVGGGGRQLVQAGKSGTIYVLNRENLGGYNPNNTNDVGFAAAQVSNVFGAPAYWNGNIYIWSLHGSLEAFGFANGTFTSSNPTSTSSETVAFPPSTPSISANGTTNGIVWSLKTDNYSSQGRTILYAHDASNVANLLYQSGTTTSDSNYTRDNPGNSVKFAVPTVVNGKVYVGTESQISVFGLLAGTTQAAAPAISPTSQSFTTSIQVSMTEGTSGASIYYTTDGSTPTTSSAVYSGPFTVSSTETINAIAGGPGFLQSPVASATYTLSTQAVSPTFVPAPGSYSTAQSVTISTTTANATIYYTTDGTTPTTSSTKYIGPVTVSVSETLSAIAVASGLSSSPVVSGFYSIVPQGVSTINFGSGFSAGGMNLVGSAELNGSVLRLTDGGTNEASAAWYDIEANIQNFTTDFTFLISGGTSPTADGFTFTIQGNNPTALGDLGGSLGYGSNTTGALGIGKSIAVKFDLYGNNGEGADSTGLYTNGAWPTTPAVDMTGSGVNLHSGDPFHVHMTYDGTNLAMTITDTVTNGTFSNSWPINIPTTVHGNVAYVGFTGGTGGLTAIQDIQNWTFISSITTLPTITTLSSSAETIVSGQSVTFTAAVAATSGTSSPTGTVTFSDGTVVLGTIALSSANVEAFTTSNLAVGSHSVTAAYSGDPNFSSSTSTSLVVAVSGFPTTTTESASATQLTSGQSLTLNVNVSPASGSIIPTGTVTFFDGQTSIGSETLVAGVASLQISTLTVGNHSLTAMYSGDANFSSSTSSAIVVTVSAPAKIATGTLLLASVMQLTSGQRVTFTATVTPQSGSGVPTGSITFIDGQTQLGTSALNAGSSTFTTTSLSVGTHTITTNYSGDSNYAASGSSAVTINVTAAPAADYSLSLSSSSLILAPGASGSLTITVSPQNGFKQILGLGCSGIPSGATCNFNPQSVNPTAGVVTTTLTVQVPSVGKARIPLNRPLQLPPAALFCILAIAFIGIAAATSKERLFGESARYAGPVLTSILFSALLVMAGCASSGGTQNQTTQTTTYVVTVTASAPNAPSHSEQFALNVKP